VEFNYEDWMPEVPLVHLDTTAADIDRSVYRRVLDVVGPLAPALARLAEAPVLDSGWDEAGLARRRERMFRDLAAPPGAFGPRAALALLREALPAEGVMTCDVGAHTHLIGQMWPTPAPQRQLMTNGWSSMGFGVPAAIAARLCLPDRPVVCVTGDGGFLMMAGELAVAARLALPVVFVVLDDRRLELIRIKQERKGFARYGTLIYNESYRPPAGLFGVPVLEARDTETYRAALDQALRADGPTVVEAFIDGSEYDELILRKHK
jgi:acetolactate synthase-1/2/3 large subunit